MTLWEGKDSFARCDIGNKSGKDQKDERKMRNNKEDFSHCEWTLTTVWLCVVGEPRGIRAENLRGHRLLRADLSNNYV